MRRNLENALALLILLLIVVACYLAWRDRNKPRTFRIQTQSSEFATPETTDWHFTGQIGPYAVDVYAVALADAPPSATSAPSVTPTAPPTNTPRPTATRTPTATPSTTAPATVTQTSPPTPTPEHTALPTLEPQPTTPPPDNVCYATATVNLSVRDGVGTSANRIGGLTVGQVVRVFEVAYDTNDNEWARILWEGAPEAWSAALYNGAMYLAYDPTPECLAVRFPETELRIGPHMLFNASTDRLAELLAVAGVVKEVSGDGHLLRFAESVNPGVVTVYRYVDDSLGNCAPAWMDGAQWFDALYPHWPAGVDWVELTNECADFDRSYSNTFTIQAMQRANEVGVCLLLYSFGVGNPQIDFMPQIVPALDYALAHECQPGRHHALAMHAYGLGEPRENVWLFSRWRQLCGAMPGYCDRLGIYFTEWEHYENEADPVDCARVVDNVEWALAEYQNTPIRGVMLWSFGDLAPWRDVTGCAGALVGALG